MQDADHAGQTPDLPGIDEQADYPEQPRGGILRSWHLLFHSTYQRQIAAELQSLKRGEIPVLIRMNDTLSLTFSGETTECEVAGQAYHRLKTLSHIPVALYLYLAQREQVAQTDLAALKEGIEQLSASGDDRALAGSCQAFLEGYCRDGVMGDNALLRLRQDYNRVVNRLIRQASREAVEAMDKAVRKFEAHVDSEMHWSELYCVVCSGHQPRYGELNKQYFQQYLQQHNIGDANWEHRLIYGEGVTESEAALQLVAQRRVDERIGAVLLGSSYRLNRDVLAHAASVALERRDLSD